MILINNIGNRDVQHVGRLLDRNNVRQVSEEILNNYGQEIDNLAFPIIQPYLDKFSQYINNIFIFVTNQLNETVNSSDTLYFGEILKKWISNRYKKTVNITEYSSDPTNYEEIYRFFTRVFTEKGNPFKIEDKKIVSLSGGTPQMNGALYVVLSSLFSDNIEFYNVYEEQLIPVNREEAITKVFVKRTCNELLNGYQYQAIVELLEVNNVQNRDVLTSFLNYAHHRKNFNFEKAKQFYEDLKERLPASELDDYAFVNLDDIYNPINLIKELYWNIELCFNNKNYLLLVAFLFRLEEAILFEINNYLFRDKIKGDLNKKETHPRLTTYLEKNDHNTWKALQDIIVKGQPLRINPNDLNRTNFYFLAKLSIKDLQKGDSFQISNILDVFDRINKYDYDNYDESRKKEGTKCLGDLRNSSIIAHGFEPVSLERIQKLYGYGLERLVSDLQKHLKILLQKLSGNKKLSLENIFEQINEKLAFHILNL